MYVQKNGIIYSVNKSSENNERFYDRMKFIFMNLKTDKNDFEHKSKLANCYINHKYLGVLYNKEIMDAIQPTH